MTREYATTPTEIRKPGHAFRALNPDEKLLGLMLASQPDITACGVLPLRMRRWAGMISPDSTSEDVEKTLQGLIRARFAVVDWDEEQVLIRPFIGWDKGYTNKKRRDVIVRTANEVTSRLIRADLVLTFERFGLPALAPEHVPDDETLHVDIPDTPESLFSQVDSLSRGYRVESDSPRQKTLAVTGLRDVDPGSWIPDLSTCEQQDRFREFYEAYPRHRGRAAAEQKWAKALSEGADPDELIAGAHRYATEVKGKDPHYIAHPATWLYQCRWEDEPDPEYQPTPPSPPMSRAAQWRALMSEEPSDGT